MMAHRLRYAVKKIRGVTAVALTILLTGPVRAQEALPENPGFTPEQAEAQARDPWSQNLLNPKGLTPPAQTRATIRIDGKSEGRRWGGIGSTPSTAMERQLMHYPKAIQEDILDLCFKPNFGMAITHLKVEVGGDNNSTGAVEPSFAHTREEMANPNFRRGGLYWLMRKARDRNPGIELGALAWTQPYWVGEQIKRTDVAGNGSFYTQESADYFTKFFEGARKEWGLEMQFFSAEQNERGHLGRRDWVINHLKPTFDRAGFEHVKFVLDGSGWPLRHGDDDPELLKHVGARGAHYVENAPKVKSATAEAKASGFPLWSTECWSRVGRGWPMVMFFADTVARGYVESKLTQFTTWPLLGGGLPGSMYTGTGLMQTDKPWSGYYEIYPTVWITAHFNQFAPMGWKTVDSGCGALFVESIPPIDTKFPSWPRSAKGPVQLSRVNYLTFKSPDGNDYSIVVVNNSPFARTLDFELKDLPAKPLHKWISNEKEQFVRTGEVATSDGTFTLEMQPWSVCSMTTTTGQHKGQPKNPIPADSILALPYGDDFESYEMGSDARYQSVSAGYFEVFQAPGEGKTLRQVVPAKGLTWSFPRDNYPSVALGDIRWSDYEVTSDAFLEGAGTAALWARVEFFRDHGMAGYYLRYDHEGKWELGVANNRHMGNRLYTEKTLASGQLAGFKPQAWHKLTICAEGTQLRASIDGKQVAEVNDGKYENGAVGYSTWAENIQKDFEDMKAASVVGTKYGHARFDNLMVRPLVEGLLHQVGWKASATTESAHNQGSRAIDGKVSTFWRPLANSNGKLPQTLTIDMGRSHLIREVLVQPNQGKVPACITRYALHLSEDGKTFVKIAEGQWVENADRKSVAFTPKGARFVRLEALEGSGAQKADVSVAELQVVGRTP
jgi:galactosylceramidase